MARKPSSVNTLISILSDEDFRAEMSLLSVICYDLCSNQETPMNKLIRSNEPDIDQEMYCTYKPLSNKMPNILIFYMAMQTMLNLIAPFRTILH